nr:head-tail connector protein [uncultured Gammaproteobacteria bacterium]
MNVEQLLKRYETLKAQRYSWDVLWDDIALYVMPNRADFVTKRSTGDKGRTDKVYDSTAIHSNEILATSLHGALTPAQSPWFTIRFRDDELNEDDTAMEWMEECTRRMYDSLGESNFNSEINEMYLDLGCFGTSVVFLEEGDKPGDWGGLRFETIHLSEVCVAENAKGKVDTIYRKFELPARAAAARWNAEMPKIHAALETTPDKKYAFLHCVHPNTDAAYGKEMALPTDRPFFEYYISVADKAIIEEGGYYELPYFVPRWAKISGDAYGFGRGQVARAHVKVLNEAKRLELKAWEKSIDPPYMAGRNAIIDNLHLEPGGLTFVRDMNELRPLGNATQWNATQLKSQELIQQIRNMFFADQLQLPERPNATATEIKLRYEMMQRLLAPTLGRLQSELLNPLVERVFFMMFRSNQFNPPPESVLASRSELDIEYVSPLARAQKMGDVEAIERWMGDLKGMYEVNPEVMDTVDFDEVSRLLADRQGVPADVRRGEQEMGQLREQRMQQQQALMQQQMEMQSAGQGPVQGAGAADV